MTLSLFPVVVPYRLGGSVDAVYTVQATAAAEHQAVAVETGTALATHWARLRQPGQRVELLRDRISVGTPVAHAGGPTLYVLTTRDAVHAIPLPPRIDTFPGEKLGETLAGLDSAQVWALIIDCQRLHYINTVGLTAIAAHVRRLRIHLSAVPEPVQKVFDIVGLSRYLAIFPDLGAALAAVPAPAPAKV